MTAWSVMAAIRHRDPQLPVAPWINYVQMPGSVHVVAAPKPDGALLAVADGCGKETHWPAAPQTDTATASHPSQPYRIHKCGNAARADETSTGQPATTRLQEKRQRAPAISQAENGM